MSPLWETIKVVFSAILVIVFVVTAWILITDGEIIMGIICGILSLYCVILVENAGRF